MATEANIGQGTELTQEQIIAHNAEITRQISAKKTEKGKYERVGGQASSIASSLLDLSTNADEIGGFLEVFRTTGTSFDNGNFKQIGANFKNMSSFFSNIKRMCDEEIARLEGEIGALQANYW